MEVITMAVIRQGTFYRSNGEAVSEASIECSLYVCQSTDVEEIDEKVSSGLHNKVKCINGHITHGIPTAEFRNTLKVMQP